MKITYSINKKIEIDKIIDLLYLADYLPIADMKDTRRLTQMFEQANLVVSAYHDQRLVGISRSLTDYSYCCYLSDICVDKAYRKLHIGKELISRTKTKAGEECKLILQSSAEALGFYEKIGMKKIDDAFIIQRDY